MMYQNHRARLVHVWFVPVGALNIWFVRRWRWLLSHWEQRRLERLREEADKVRFVAAHLLVRLALSKLYPAALTDWRLDHTVAGKPFVCGPHGAEGFQFSLSHAAGLVGCAVANAPVGLDVEPLNQSIDVDELLPCTLGPQELSEWNQRPCEDRVRRYLAYWTLKEALAKGLGVGMNVPFSSLAFELEDDSHAHVLTLPVSLGDASGWKVRLLDFMGTYVGAVAVSSEPGEAIELNINRLEPRALVNTFQGELLSLGVRDLPEGLLPEGLLERRGA
jgi:4'-phosphopantetheinyl transferase